MTRIKYISNERYIVVYPDGTPVGLSKSFQPKKAERINDIAFLDDFEIANFIKGKLGQEYTIVKINFIPEIVNLHVSVPKNVIYHVEQNLPKYEPENLNKQENLFKTRYENHDECPKCLHFTLPRITKGLTAVKCQNINCGYIYEV